MRAFWMVLLLPPVIPMVVLLALATLIFSRLERESTEPVSVGIRSLPTPEAGPPDPTLLLPDLRTRAPSDLRIETIRGSDRRLLRLSNTVWNDGAAPLELLGRSDDVSGRTRVTQQLRGIDGTSRESSVGEFTFHPRHNHWHFDAFAVYEVWSMTPDGDLDTVMAAGDKVTYCIMDTTRVAPRRTGAAEQAEFTSCGQVRQGVSVGWGDTYGAGLAGQEVDVTAVPDGVYALVSTADPENRIQEADETNNAAAVVIELRENEVEIVSADT